jgi:hypothetical protein
MEPVVSSAGVTVGALRSGDGQVACEPDLEALLWQESLEGCVLYTQFFQAAPNLAKYYADGVTRRGEDDAGDPVETSLGGVFRKWKETWGLDSARVADGNVTHSPIPATALLFGAGLAGLLGLRRKLGL